MKPRLFTLYFFLLLLILGCSGKKQWHIYTTNNTILSTNFIRQIIIKNNSLAWVGTYGGGLYRLQEDRWEKISHPFTGDYILCFETDSYGGLWIGTARNGAYYYYQDNWTHIGQEQGLAGNNVWDIFIDSNEDIWFCSRYKGVCRKSSDSLIYLGTKQGLPDRQVTVAAEDNTGTIWLGTARGGLCGYKNGQFQYLNTRNGLSGNYIRALICDSVPRWVGSWDGGLDYFNGNQWEHLDEIKRPVVFLGFDRNKCLWVGTWGHGVYVKQAHAWEHLTEENCDLPNNHVIDIAFDEKGDIYFATSKGIAIYTP